MTQYNQDTTYFRRDVYFKDIVVNGVDGVLGSITLNGDTRYSWPSGGSGGNPHWVDILGSNVYLNTALANALNAKANTSDLTPLTNNLNTVSANLNTLSGNVLILSAYDIQNTLNLSYLSGVINDIQSDVMNIAVVSGNFNNTYNTVYTLSANWNSVYNTFNSTSSLFLTSVDLTNYALISSVHSVISGGSVGQTLIKASSADYDLTWGSGGGGTWGSITGLLSAQTDLWNNLITLSGRDDLSVDSLVHSSSAVWSNLIIDGGSA